MKENHDWKWNVYVSWLPHSPAPAQHFYLFSIFPAFSGSLSCLSCACLLQKISTSSWLLVLTCLLLKSTGSSFCSPPDHDVYVTFRLSATLGICRFMWMSSCLRWHPTSTLCSTSVNYCHKVLNLCTKSRISGFCIYKLQLSKSVLSMLKSEKGICLFFHWVLPNNCNYIWLIYL